MGLPFGFDLKSIILGVVFAYFILPRILAFVTGLRGGESS